MSNGCICCTLREDLLVEVRKLAAEGRFDYLLIESTGIGEPLPVAATFDFTDENGDSLGEVAQIDTMVTVVDAHNLLADYTSTDLLEQRGETAGPEDTRTLAALLTEQIEFADVVVVNKIDKVDKARRDEVTAVVKALNPVARVVFADHGRVPLKEVLGTGLFDMERASQMPGWVRELEGQHTPETEAYGIESFVLRSHEPLHPWRFSTFMDLPLPGLLRAKGYVWLASRPEWVVSYSRAGNTATHEPVGRWWAAAPKSRWPTPGTAERRSIDARWKEPYGDRLNEVVFIGRGMDRAAIEQAWKAMHLNYTETRKGPPGGKGFGGWADLPDPFPQWHRKEVAA
jgi:G3E family GTPase